jgi:hypothetical protein
MAQPVELPSQPAAPAPAAPRRERAFGAAALKTALVVGTVLTLINRPELVGLGPGPDHLAPLLNYVVPFLVAGYSRHRLLGRFEDGRGG